MIFNILIGVVKVAQCETHKPWFGLEMPLNRNNILGTGNKSRPTPFLFDK